jgi:hypothetical protein
VRPFDGSAFVSPVAGVIVTTGPAGLGDAVADALAECDAFPAGLTVLVAFPVHAASVSAATALTPISPMRLMPKPFPTS